MGSHLLHNLARAGENLRAIYRTEESLEGVKNVFSYYNSSEETFNRIDWVKADIMNLPSLATAFKDVDYVYHCAAKVSFDTSKDADLRKINIEGTANVVNFCIRNSVKKLCHVSSIATFNLKPAEKVITEMSFWNKELDHNMYAITKYGAEMEVWRASQEGIPVVIVNPGVIIGPGFWNKGSGKIFKKVNDGLDYYFPKTTGFVGVWDVVKAMKKLMDSPVKNEQFILVSENLSFEEIFRLTAKNLQRPAPSKRLKKGMVFVAWIWQEISGMFSEKEKQLDYRSRKSLFEQTFYSSEKLREKFNFEFESIEHVIDKTARAFREDSD